MFLSFFKRKPPAVAKPEVAPAKTAVDERAAQAAARQSSLLKAAALAGNERGAADFILQCSFADARLAAAQHIHGQIELERVAQAMRNTDRRVAKLMQQRLDTLAREREREKLALACLALAQKLVDGPTLMVNQVADLDRAWQEADCTSGATQTLFAHQRGRLRERLQAQAALQRAVIDLSTRLRTLMKEVIEAPASHEPVEVATSLAAIDAELTACRQSPEASSLPRQLLADHERLQATFAAELDALEKRRAALAAHEAALSGWEAAPPDELHEEKLLKDWRALPAPHGADLPHLRARFDALAEAVRAARKPREAEERSARQTARTVAQGPVNNSKFDDAAHDTVSAILASLETAVADGALQAAAEQDRALRSMDLKAYRLSAMQTARLARARAELGNLQGWAKWGGNVSREELLKAAEDLPTQGIAVLELAKKVGSLRERWKSLDNSAGPSGKDLWQRFDAACSLAYAPAAEHFKKLADERHQNLAVAQDLVTQVREFAAATVTGVDAAEVDWKAVAGFCTRITQAWQRLGSVDRRERKKRDADFTAALQELIEPLALQQQAEIARREALIAEAAGLDPADRRTLELMQALQERWQEQSRALPLARSDEQALWLQFRAVCDDVFAKRKLAGRGAEAERRANLERKLALCERLEAVVAAAESGVGAGAHPGVDSGADSEADSRADSGAGPKADTNDGPAPQAALRAAQDDWSRTGHVPRSAERELDQRWRNAVDAVAALGERARQDKLARQYMALGEHLGLCRDVEQKLARGENLDQAGLASLRRQWTQTPDTKPEHERLLRGRFEKALLALENQDAQHLAQLRENQPLLQREVLRLEILNGQPSPPELAQERLRLQVEVLKSSLGAGEKPVTADLQLLQLCAMPALSDAGMAARIDRLLALGARLPANKAVISG